MATKPALLALCAGLMVLLAGAPAGAEGNQFTARLSTVPVDFANRAGKTGAGTATAVLTGNKLSVSGTFQGLSSPATSARVHIGGKGIGGPELFDLTATKAPEGTINGSFDLSKAQVENLQAGHLYIQLQSQKAPEGNLRGWLLK
jgi:hypothetical protein